VQKEVILWPECTGQKTDLQKRLRHAKAKRRQLLGPVCAKNYEVENKL
tara:strand:- start:608 stop:751 length:144 start_codon:yes stop_codon:yes gene_type:complete